MSDRYAQMFTRLKAEGAGAFVPFVTIGDPDLDLSARIMDALVEAGADALELGIPFSDPVADGPTIQAATQRALANGTTPARCWSLLTALRTRHPDVPVGLLVYANLVVARGMDDFYARAAAAGVDSVLVADVPTVEAEPFCAAARRHGIAPVMIAPPNADEARLATVARMGGGYTYVVARGGVTGADDEVELQSPSAIFAQLKAHGAPPSVLGFGISKPAHVTATLEAGAAGAISGSAIVGRIERLSAEPEHLLAELRAFVRGMKAATVGHATT